MVVEIQKTLCGGRNTDNLIDSLCFGLKINLVHVLFQILVESARFAMELFLIITRVYFFWGFLSCKMSIT